MRPRELHRVGAVGRLADDLDVRLRVEQRAEARAHERLIVGEQDAWSRGDATVGASSGSRASHAPAAGRRRSRIERPAERRRALAHSAHAVAAPAPASAGRQRDAVIGHLDRHGAGDRFTRTPALDALRMAGDVRQRLLDDPVAACLHRRRDIGGGLDVELESTPADAQTGPRAASRSRRPAAGRAAAPARSRAARRASRAGRSAPRRWSA